MKISHYRNFLQRSIDPLSASFILHQAPCFVIFPVLKLNEPNGFSNTDFIYVAGYRACPAECGVASCRMRVKGCRYLIESKLDHKYNIVNFI